MGFCEWFDKQDKVIKIILLIPFWGWIFSLIYRIVAFAEHKDIASLIGFILTLFIGFIVALVDLITVITNDKILFLVYGGENFGINGTVDSTNQKTEDKKDDSIKAEVKEEKKEEAEKESEDESDEFTEEVIDEEDSENN